MWDVAQEIDELVPSFTNPNMVQSVLVSWTRFSVGNHVNVVFTTNLSHKRFLLVNMWTCTDTIVHVYDLGKAIKLIKSIVKS